MNIVFDLKNIDEYERLRDKYLASYIKYKETFYNNAKNLSTSEIKSLKEKTEKVATLVKIYDRKAKCCLYHNCKHVWFTSKYGTFCLKCHLKPRCAYTHNKPKLISNTNASRCYMGYIKCTTVDKVNEYINSDEYVLINCPNVTARAANYIAQILKEKYGDIEPKLFKYLFENELENGTHCRMLEGNSMYKKNN